MVGEQGTQMTSIRAVRWSSLALLAVLAAPSSIWAQRSGDDADSYSDSVNARGGSEPPRLMRGGIMQQLRSVTESVMGTQHDDKPATKTPAKSGAKSSVPTPPPLGSKRPTQNQVVEPMHRTIFNLPMVPRLCQIVLLDQVALGLVSS